MSNRDLIVTGEEESQSRASTPGLMDKRKRRPDGNDGNSTSPAVAVNSKRPRGGKLRQVSLNDLSCPPTQDELANFVDVPAVRLPRIYKRTPEKRVFVNRAVNLEDIKFFGFDMDYTLANYKSPAYEELAYELIVERLVEIGYPAEIAQRKYDPSFAIRGLFYDQTLGNLLKVDQFGNVLLVFHGRRALSDAHAAEAYPNLFVHADEIGRRYYVLNTLFNLPETCLYADVIDCLEQHPDFTCTDGGFATASGAIHLSYASVYQDVRRSVDWVHQKGTLKSKTCEQLEKYVERSERLPTLLDRMRERGCKVFLLTNSGSQYTEAIMTYLFDFPGRKPWQSYFDIAIVDAGKPNFFEEGSGLKEVNKATGRLHIGTASRFEQGKIYSGGNSTEFHRLSGAVGNSVLYIGDHIFGDVRKSKKQHAWKTFLQIPELNREVQCHRQSREVHNHLANLSFMLAETYRGLDSQCQDKPDVASLTKRIEAAECRLNETFNCNFGSLFRSGSNQTFFAMQTQRFADLYADSFLNLLEYPFFYDFRPSAGYLAHESVSWEEEDDGSSPPPAQQPQASAARGGVPSRKK